LKQPDIYLCIPFPLKYTITIIVFTFSLPLLQGPTTHYKKIELH
jgi:hypothetical protein